MIPKKPWSNKDNGDSHNSKYKNMHDDDDKKNPPTGGTSAKPKKPKPSAPSGGRAVSITPGESLIKSPSYGSYERSR